jgi:hypothetical protein
MIIASTAVTTTIITTSVAVLGIVVGWFVIGTQRVTEELTRERRKAYVDLLAEVDEMRAVHLARSEPAAGQRLTPPDAPPSDELAGARRQSLDGLRSTAELLSSDQMRRSKLLTSLVAMKHADEDSWSVVRDRFLIAARLDTHRNSSRLRSWAELRSDAYKPLSETGSHGQIGPDGSGGHG